MNITSLVLLNIIAFILVVQICAKEVNAFYFRPNAKRKTNYLWALKRFIVYCPICARLPEESKNCALFTRNVCVKFHAGVDRKLIQDRSML